jgi:hypothetical protein
MSKRIDFLVSDEFDAQIELMCSLNSTNKYKWISGLIHDEMVEFFKNRKKAENQEKWDQNEKNMRKSWSLDEVTNKNLINIGKSHVFPIAY